MEEFASGFGRLARELYRRRVPRVATAYLVAGWAVATFAGDVASFLELPVWAPKLILALLILGFPVTIAVSWAFDLTTQGVVRTPAEHDLAPRLVARRSYGKPIGAVVIGVMVVFLAVWNLWRPGQGGGRVPTSEVAVLPAIIHGDPGLEYLAETVATLVATKLERMGWRIADRDAVFRAARLQNPSDPEWPARIARAVEARSYVNLRVSLDAGIATVHATRFDVEDPTEALDAAESTARFEQLLQAVDHVCAALTGRPTETRTRVAVMPAAVVGAAGGAPWTEQLSELFPTLLSAKLEVAGWPTIDDRSLAGKIKSYGADPADAGAAAGVARDMGADFFVLSRIRLAEDAGGIIDPERRGASLEVELYDLVEPTEAARSYRRTGRLQELPRLADEVAHDLLSAAGLRLEGVVSTDDVPSRSLSALAAYSRGEREFRNGHYEKAVEAFDEAVTLDDAFALAYYRLSVAAGWLSNAYSPWRTIGLERAIAHGDRLTWRQKLLVEGLARQEAGGMHAAEQVYRWILGQWTEDYEAWFQLGELLFHSMPLYGRSAVESRLAWEQAMRYEPDDFGLLMHLVRIQALERDTAGIENNADRSVELAPEDERRVELDAYRASAASDGELLQGTIAALSGKPTRQVFQVASRVGMYTKNMGSAQRIASLLGDSTRPQPDRALGHIVLAYLLVAQGRWQAAQRQLAAARSLDPLSGLVHTASLATTPMVPPMSRSELLELQDGLRSLNSPIPTGAPVTELTVHDSINQRLVLYARGVVALGLGVEREALSIAAQLGNLPGSDDARWAGQQMGLSLRAMAHWRRGAVEAARQEWEPLRVRAGSDKLFNSPFFALSRDRFLRALILKETGRLDEALIQLSSFAEVSVFDLAYLAPALFHRAEIQELMGDVAAAQDDYRRVIELWRDADPELQPMVERARQRLRSRPAATD